MYLFSALQELICPPIGEHCARCCWNRLALAGAWQLCLPVAAASDFASIAAEVAHPMPLDVQVPYLMNDIGPQLV